MKRLERVRVVAMRLRLAPSTIDAYSAWIRGDLARSARATGRWIPPEELATADVEAYLNHLVCERHLSVSSQNQCLCALVFLYKQVLRSICGALRAIRGALRAICVILRAIRGALRAICGILRAICGALPVFRGETPAFCVETRAFRGATPVFCVETPVFCGETPVFCRETPVFRGSLRSIFSTRTAPAAFAGRLLSAWPRFARKALLLVKSRRVRTDFVRTVHSACSSLMGPAVICSVRQYIACSWHASKVRAVPMGG